MLRAVLLLGLFCMICPEIGWGTESAFDVAPADIDAVIRDIRQKLLADPLSMQFQATHARQMLTAEPDLDLSYQLRLALIPRVAFESGYSAARIKLDELANAIFSSDSGLQETTQIAWFEASIQLDYRYGYLERGLRELVSMGEKVAELPHRADLRALAELYIYMVAALPRSGGFRQAVDSFPFAATVQHCEICHLLKLAQLFVALRDFERVDRYMEAAGQMLNRNTSPEQVAEYWWVRCWQALHANSRAKFEQFYTEFVVSAVLPENALWLAKIGFLELMGRLRWAPQSPIEAEEWQQLRRHYVRAGFPAGLHYHLILAREITGSVIGDGFVERIQFPMRTGLALAGRPMLQLEVLQMESDIAMRRGNMHEAYWNLRRAIDLQRRLQTEMMEYEKRWQNLLPRLIQTEERQAEANYSGDYLIIFSLILLVLVLLLALRNHAQRDINARLFKAVKQSEAADQERLRNERLRKKFLANISHEIKTPMNGLIGMASLLEELVENGRQRRCVQAIRQCADNLMILMSDLLALAQLDSGDWEPDPVCFSLSAWAVQWHNYLNANAEKKGLTARFDMENTLQDVVLADPQIFTQILSKLVYNAVWSSENGEISVAVTMMPEGAEAGQITLEVSASEAVMGELGDDTLFESMGHLPEHAASTDGMGLGLSLCQRWVTLLGGTLTLHRQGKHGSAYRVRLPVRLPSEEQWRETGLQAPVESFYA